MIAIAKHKVEITGINTSEIKVLTDKEKEELFIRLIIYDKKGFFSLKASDEVGIKWSQIKKIGTDVILVTKNT